MENKENKKINSKKSNTVEKTNLKVNHSNKNKNSYSEYFREKYVINNNKANLEPKPILSPKQIINDKKTFSPKFTNNKKIFDNKNSYLERINNSRKMQKQKEEKMNPDYNKLYDKLTTNKKIPTAQDKNKKLTKKQYDKYINAFHNAIMSEN